MKVPQLEKKLELKSCHNKTWEDNYSWIHQSNILDVLKDSSKLLPKTRKYLEQENSYFEHQMKDTKEIQKKIFNEIKGRIKLDDESLPFKDKEYEYWTKTTKEGNYSIREIKEAGYTIFEMLDAGCTASEMRQLNICNYQLHTCMDILKYQQIPLVHMAFHHMLNRRYYHHDHLECNTNVISHHQRIIHMDDLNLFSISPKSLVIFTVRSDWNLLLSTTIINSFNPSWDTRLSDSQICPSCNSPSPVRTITFEFMPFKRLALIIPFDLEIPIPNDPVLVNILGVLISGWPGNPSIFLNLFNSEKFNFPYAIKELYSAGASCPLDEKKYSFS